MLNLKFATAQEIAEKNAKKLENERKRRSFNAENISKEDIEELLKFIKRPFDHKNKKPFHFITVERNGMVFLFDGFNRLVKAFEEEENESELYFHRRIRLFALELFEKSERQNGGFLYNDQPFDHQHLQNSHLMNIGKVYNLLTLEKNSECELCDNPAVSKIYLGGIMTKTCEECLKRERKIK
jgi:hypothetical protein